MPIDPENDIFIELDRGEQLRIEKDTDHLWRPQPISASPVSNLALEGGGRCFYYHLEGGVWYCSEYIGNSKRIPEYKKKYKASETKAKERERARQKWEEEREVVAISTGMVNADSNAPGMPGRPTTGPENAGATPHRAGHDMSIPEPGMTATSRLEPRSPLAAQNQIEPHFSSTDITDPPAFPTPTHFPAVDTGIAGDGLQFMNMPRVPSLPPSFPSRLEGHTPLPLSFPPSFPFDSSHPAPQTPSFPPSFPFDDDVSVPGSPNYTSPPYPSYQPYSNEPSFTPAVNSGRHSGRTVIGGGEYVQAGGRVVNSGINNPSFVAGHGADFNWSPDLHRERNGTYNANWSR